jgi:hypothetical protein
MRVECYFNLHKRTFSVRALEGANKGRVIHHSDHVRLDDPKFVVQEGGRQRVIREKRKNVHAFVRGELKGLDAGPFGTYGNDMVQVTYNPYKYDSFVRKSDETPINGACRVLLENRRIWVDKQA